MSEIKNTSRLADPACLAFPFRVADGGPATSKRAAHLRELISQVLFTAPGERMFRPEFGAGVGTLVFEPNRSPLWEVTKRRIQAGLAEVLRGEVDPGTIDVDVDGENEKLEIVVRYELAAVNVAQLHRFEIGRDPRG